jgi:16S rRNA (cytosine967-C5)-methyltransferase
VEDLFRISGDINAVVTSDLFQSGAVLIHDKASVLTAKALHASEAEILWDACAAPGMKTHLLTEMMSNTGRVVASDVYTDRVRSAKERSEFLGVRNACWVQADASKMKVKGARRVLIDAPCSSTGMIQGHPSFKWRLNKEVLMSIMSVQHKILDGVLSAYRDEPGTEIVYATCSILPHEGESQIDSVMSTHNIELIDTEIGGDEGYDGFQCSEMVRRLFPHKHETSGFFIARMRIVQ